MYTFHRVYTGGQSIDSCLPEQSQGYYLVQVKRKDDGGEDFGHFIAVDCGSRLVFDIAEEYALRLGHASSMLA